MLNLHVWDSSTLVTFTRRVWRGHLAVMVQALIQGFVTPSAVQFRRVTKVSTRHGVGQLAERTTNLLQPMLGKLDCNDQSVIAGNLTIDFDA